MSYILHNVRPAALQVWIAANAPGSIRATPRESWRAYLQANGGTGITLRDLEMSFLLAAGSTGGTLFDCWGKNLIGTTGAKNSEQARNRYK